MVRSLTFFVILLLPSVTVLAAESGAERGEIGRGEITGNGESSALLSPDTARLTVLFQGSAGTAQELDRTLEKKISSVTAALKKTAENAQIQRRAQRYLNAADKSPALSPGRTIEGAASLVVETAELGKVSALIDAALAGGASAVSEVRYLVKDGTVARTAALREATKRAGDQARAAAASLGANLGELVSADIGEDANGASLEKLRSEESEMGEYDDREYYVYVTLRYAVEKNQQR